MAKRYNYWPQEKGDTFDDCIKDESYEEQPFDENILTLLQRIEIDELEKENPMLTRHDLATMTQINLVSYQAAFEGREATMCEIMVAKQFK